MPKLIIPNAYELYQLNTDTSDDKVNARYFYNLRFLWLLEAGDAIILPKPPVPGFIEYLAKIKNIEVSSLNIILLTEHTSLTSFTLSDPTLIADLQAIIIEPANWKIHACYYNQHVLHLAQTLGIPVKDNLANLIHNDGIKGLNSKSFFRNQALLNGIPIPHGRLCYNEIELEVAITSLLNITGQVIVKQLFNASGKGNIGIGMADSMLFQGVIERFTRTSVLDINKLAEELWASYAENKCLIVEVYYPNQGSVTAQFHVSENDIKLVNTSEIMMNGRWSGVHIPPTVLSPAQREILTHYGKKLAAIIQKQGYEGYICCDAILTHTNDLLFNEINVRAGAETNAYLLTDLLFPNGIAGNHIQTGTMKTQHTFTQLYTELINQDLLVNSESPNGIAILTMDETTKTWEYYLSAPTVSKLQDYYNLAAGAAERSRIANRS